jgi:GAF domain-containing protein
MATGRQKAKTRATSPKRDKLVRKRKPMADNPKFAVSRLKAELRESLEQQTATTEVLEVINASQGDLAPVFDVMLEKAMRFCEAAFGVFASYDGELVRPLAYRGLDRQTQEVLSQHFAPSTGTLMTEALERGAAVTVPDLRDTASYRSGVPSARILADGGGARTVVWVPLRKDDRSRGVLVLYRREVRAFTDKQISLLQNFAAQAVIAMENARLLGELRGRTDDLTESLEYQTATSSVLKVISRSTFDMEPVLNTLAETALQLCAADQTFILREEGQVYRVLAGVGSSPDNIATVRQYRAYLDTHPIEPGRGTVAGRAVLERRPVHIHDIATDPEYKLPQAMTLGNVHTTLGVPLLRDGEPVGVIVLSRQRVEPFTARQIELVRTFADQAVIALENTRLFTELQQRTDDLTESLRQQTATADVLKVISRSTFDLKAVLHTLVESASRLCEADKATITRLRDGVFYREEAYGFSPEFVDYMYNLPVQTGRDTATGRAILERGTVHIADVETDPDFGFEEGRKLGGFRTVLAVPMLRDGAAIGALALTRSEVRPFSEKQIELVKTFADQAVIAMENARLLGELRESLDQQTATSDVLRTISRSSVSLESVLETLVETVARLCRADQAYMFRRREDLHHLVAAHGLSDEAREYVRSHPFEPGRGNTSGRVALERRTIQVTDVLADPEYTYNEGQKIAGFRTMLGIPLMAQDNLVGVFVVTRTQVDPFTDKEIALAGGFADQAVIAIENARLFEELRDRQAELRVTFDNMGDGVVMFDADLRLAAWNKNFQELLDVPDHFLASRPGLEDYVRLLVQRGELGNRDADKEVTRYRDRASRQWSAERTRPDGRVLEVRNNPVPDGGAVLIYSDITKRKQAETEIRAARDAAEAALERQTATADILKVIASSPTDVQPVLDAVAKAAVRFCGAADAIIALREGDDVMVAAHEGPVGTTIGDRSALDSRGRGTGRAIIERRTIHVPDVEAFDQKEFAQTRKLGRAQNFRAFITAPMMREGVAVGSIGLRKPEPGPFTPQQIELLETFAAQAVIAIENVRLFTELRDSLEQQTATADILRVISQSPTDVGPVLSAVARAAQKFCRALDAQVALRDGDEWFVAAHEGPIKPVVGRRPVNRLTGPGRAMADGKVVQITDLQSVDGDDFPEARELGAQLGFRSALAAPLLRDDATIGAIALRRAEPGTFTPRQVDVLKSFAAQAVIAIENVRLFTELRESLEQQTATSEVLRAISQSPTDVQPVLEAVSAAARRFCGALDASITLREGEQIALSAHAGDGIGSEPIGTRVALDRGTMRGRSILDAATVHFGDVLAADPVEYGPAQQLARKLGFRAIVSTPMLRDGRAIGCVTLRKIEPVAFTPRQIELLETFAAQAVIAIENVRLFTELKESLDQQTATADILRVISQSPTDVQPVLNALVQAARRFCGAVDSMIVLREGDLIVPGAQVESPIGVYTSPERIAVDRSTIMGTAMLEGRTLHYADALALDPVEFHRTHELARQLGFRAVAAAPLMREGQAIGVLLLRKPEPGPFTERQIALLEAFAAQAVIAIENVRLFTELRDSLERLKSAQANLIQAEKMASLGQLTAGIAHEIKNPLNFVNNFAGLSVELLDELKQAAAPVLVGMSEDARAEFGETVDLISSNLEKIAEHGRRADGIVKSMLAHSRGGTGDWQASNINGLVEEALNLTYHGARAQDKDFNVTLERDFASETKLIEVVPQDVTRVFLNLFGNGFYAAKKRQLSGTGTDYRPTLTVSTRDLGEAVEIRVRDNGTGIPPEVRDKLFQPFFTTKPTGEGTGLGLSISYDIVTQQHGGSIDVESEPGSFTEFTVRLPRRRRAA